MQLPFRRIWDSLQAVDGAGAGGMGVLGVGVLNDPSELNPLSELPPKPPPKLGPPPKESNPPVPAPLAPGTQFLLTISKT